MRALVLRTTMFILVFSFLPSPSFPAVIFQNQLERDEVQRALDRFLTDQRPFIQRGLSNAVVYLSMVKDIFHKKNLPEELVYLPLIESGFSVRAYSKAGACGLWQFMPGTARDYHLRIDFWVDERRDPHKSTEKAAQHLNDLYRYYKNWELALAAYNAGIGSVDLAVKRGKTKEYWKLCKMGLLKRETREYVPRFLAASHIAKYADLYGFSFDKKKVYPEYETLLVEKVVDLSVLSQKAGIRLSTLQFLNPELRRYITPVDRKYQLRVPKNSYADVLQVYLDLPEGEFVDVQRYQVRSGDTLSGLAEKFNTSMTLLRLINDIHNPKKLYAGQAILIPLLYGSMATQDEPVRVPGKGYNTQEIHYTIRKGDTVWEIARRYRLDVETLLTINGMTFNSVIMPGDEIKLWIDTAFRR